MCSTLILMQLMDIVLFPQIHKVIVLIMRFIEMVNGNRPPAPPACKITKVRTGNYSLIWSGLVLPHCVAQTGSRQFNCSITMLTLSGVTTASCTVLRLKQARHPPRPKKAFACFCDCSAEVLSRTYNWLAQNW